jgi:hypothetical protein
MDVGNVPAWKAHCFGFWRGWQKVVSSFWVENTKWWFGGRGDEFSSKCVFGARLLKWNWHWSVLGTFWCWILQQGEGVTVSQQGWIDGQKGLRWPHVEELTGPITIAPNSDYPLWKSIETKETAQAFRGFLRKDVLAVLENNRVCSLAVAWIFWQRRGPWSWSLSRWFILLHSYHWSSLSHYGYSVSG